MLFDGGFGAGCGKVSIATYTNRISVGGIGRLVRPVRGKIILLVRVSTGVESRSAFVCNRLKAVV